VGAVVLAIVPMIARLPLRLLLPVSCVQQLDHTAGDRLDVLGG
jgi:hypothetical protein